MIIGRDIALGMEGLDSVLSLPLGRYGVFKLPNSLVISSEMAGNIYQFHHILIGPDVYRGVFLIL